MREMCKPMNPQQHIRDLAKEADAIVTAETIDEIVKILALVSQQHQEEIKAYEDVLVKIAQCFYRGIGKNHKHHPDVLYTKIIWGINDLTK